MPPDLNTLADQLVTAVADPVAQLGIFERVTRHEPKNAPGSGLTAAIWVQRIDPLGPGSGLDETSVKVEMNIRMSTNMLAEPQDEIDPKIMTAAFQLMGAYSGDFTLGGLIRSVDLLGMYGTPMSAQAGYLTHDQKLYRIMTLIIPLIINDVFDQEA